MKPIFLQLSLIIAIATFMCSCSSSASDEIKSTTSSLTDVNFAYNDLETETLKAINDYRISIGLNALEKINYISVLSEQHDNYMIAKNEINHDLFDNRSETLRSTLGAKTVSENIAYNFNTSNAVLTAWLNSTIHKAIIEGDYTNFGIAIRENPTNGYKYYTNIFIKK